MGLFFDEKATVEKTFRGNISWENVKDFNLSKQDIYDVNMKIQKKSFAVDKGACLVKNDEFFCEAVLSPIQLKGKTVSGIIVNMSDFNILKIKDVEKFNVEDRENFGKSLVVS